MALFHALIVANASGRELRIVMDRRGPFSDSAQIAGVSQGITTGLRPDRQTVALLPRFDLVHLTIGRVDAVHHVIE